MTIFNLFSKRLGGIAVTNRTSGMELFAEIVQYLQECINFEIKIGDKVCNFISLCRSPNQTLDDFETFSKNFELN